MTTMKKNKNTTTKKRYSTGFLTRDASEGAPRVINSFITICDYDEEKDQSEMSAVSSPNPQGARARDAVR